MATATIGGTLYTVPELNFAALERAWPYIEEAMISLDPMTGTSAGIRIIASGLVEQDSFNPHDFGIEDMDLTLKGYDPDVHADQVIDRVVRFLKRKLLATEIENIRACVDKITEEAGLSSPEGELPAAVEDQGTLSLSPVTAADTSQSSLPLDARGAAGTV